MDAHEIHDILMSTEPAKALAVWCANRGGTEVPMCLNMIMATLPDDASVVAAVRLGAVPVSAFDMMARHPNAMHDCILLGLLDTAHYSSTFRALDGMNVIQALSEAGLMHIMEVVAPFDWYMVSPTGLTLLDLALLGGKGGPYTDVIDFFMSHMVPSTIVPSLGMTLSAHMVRTWTEALLVYVASYPTSAIDIGDMVHLIQRSIVRAVIAFASHFNITTQHLDDKYLVHYMATNWVPEYSVVFNTYTVAELNTPMSYASLSLVDHVYTGWVPVSVLAYYIPRRHWRVPEMVSVLAGYVTSYDTDVAMYKIQNSIECITHVCLATGHTHNGALIDSLAYLLTFLSYRVNTRVVRMPPLTASEADMARHYAQSDFGELPAILEDLYAEAPHLATYAHDVRSAHTSEHDYTMFLAYIGRVQNAIVRCLHTLAALGVRPGPRYSKIIRSDSVLAQIFTSTLRQLVLRQHMALIERQVQTTPEYAAIADIF